jgi:hypothetical protein
MLKIRLRQREIPHRLLLFSAFLSAFSATSTVNSLLLQIPCRHLIQKLCEIKFSRRLTVTRQDSFDAGMTRPRSDGAKAPRLETYLLLDYQ